MHRHVRLAFALSAVALAACGNVAAPACDALSCEGCCSSDGVCHSGRGDDAVCGAGGVACVSCTSQGLVCSLAGTCITGGAGGGSGTGGGSGGGTSGTGGGTTGTGGGTSGTGGGAACTHETDQAFCTRAGKSCGTLTTFDNCGSSRTVNCGSCNTGQVCGSTGSCCTSETDGAFCTRLQKNCGMVGGTDACGISRTVNCGTCPSGTCGGGGTQNVCGQNLCNGCTSPPASSCEAPTSFQGYYRSKTYNTPGTCTNPSTGACSYSSTTTQCTEDCRGGVCVQTSCTLGGGQCTSTRTGCKLTSTGTLRCLVVDTGGSQGMPCDDDVPGYRCDSQLRCVFPSFVTTSVCAYLCVSSSDCATVGLQNQHLCVKGPSETYGYCR